MKHLLLLLFTTLSFSQLKLVSWNVENLGRSKSEATIEFIATTVKNYDIVALQEIVAGDGGAQAVAQLADELNRKGSKWDYVVSDPTSSSAYKTERYAFLWKTAKVKKIGDAWLEKKTPLGNRPRTVLLYFSISKQTSYVGQLPRYNEKQTTRNRNQVF